MMPQGPAYLHEFWQHDGNALDHLVPNFACTFGMLRKRHPRYVPTYADMKAIEYLILEWDYAYDAEP